MIVNHRNAFIRGLSLTLLGFLAFSFTLPFTPPSEAEVTAGDREIITVQALDKGGTVAVGGVVVPQKDITFTAQVPGQVVYLAGKEGTRLRKGTVLVALDEEQLRARRQQVVEQITNAEAELRNAEVQYQRELYAPQQQSGSIPFMPFDPSRMMGGANVGVERQAQLHAHRTRIDQASSALRQSQSALKEIDAKLRDTKSIAPFDGVLLKKHVEVGDTVQPGQPLVNFADTSILQIQADIAARLATGLREGTEITARLDDPNKTRATVRVAQIFPTADPVRHTIRMKFDLPMNAPVAPGMYADVLIPDPNARGMELPVIPLAAIVWRGGLPMVEVINPQGGTQLRLLRLGDPVDADQVTVLTGIREGEHIVIQRSR